MISLFVSQGSVDCPVAAMVILTTGSVLTYHCIGNNQAWILSGLFRCLFASATRSQGIIYSLQNDSLLHCECMLKWIRVMITILAVKGKATKRGDAAIILSEGQNSNRFLIPFEIR